MVGVHNDKCVTRSMADQSRKSLVEFKGHDRTFAERFVDAIFHAEEAASAGEVFSKAFSDADYAPNFIDAQHWATEVMSRTDYSPNERLAHVDLITEIFFRFLVPAREGERDFEDSKKDAIELAEEKFKDSVDGLMYGDPPETPEWFASHIYETCAEIERELDDFVEERKEIDALCDNVDDLYLSKDEEQRDVERMRPVVLAVNRAFKVGFLYRDAWWKFNHEQAAISYYSQADRLRTQSQKGADSTARRYAQLKDDCLSLFSVAYAENGIKFVGAPLNVVAETIRKIALRDRPEDFVNPKGEPLSLRWFTEALEGFQAEGKFGPAFAEAMNKANGPIA